MKFALPILPLATVVIFATVAFTSAAIHATDVAARTSITATTGVVTETSSTSLTVNGPDFYPVRYSISATTGYTDEDGQAVPLEKIKKDTPVVIHSHQANGELVASKVIVRRSAQPLPTRFDLTMEE